MSIKDGFRSFFGIDEESYLEQTESTSQGSREQKTLAPTSSSKVIPMGRKQSSGKAVVHLLEPRVYREAEQIASYLLQNEAVLLNFRRMEPDQAAKVLDFLAGTVYAVKGDFQKVGEEIFLCTPPEIVISNPLQEEHEMSTYS